MRGSADDPGAARRAVQASRSAVVLRAGLAMSDLRFDDLWIAYVGLGGTMSAAEVEAALRGELEPTAYEHNVLAQALNDHFTERGQDHPVPYAADLDEPGEAG
ncbi:hypothetical protein [Pseudonocardia lacus]|uniref:hypothetical protein n=1 Tax=Pseudonocardia lacus TaxID=2835865 RepID=UPI001BDC300B|nr:hypothetical protein [Pseudonocardia lacus]